MLIYNLRLQSFIRFPIPFLPIFFIAIAMLLTSCQILAPYKGPVAPTPAQWKTSYPPDERQEAIPNSWKETSPSQESLAPSNLQESIAEDFLQDSESNTAEQDQAETEPVLPEMTLDDVRRDLYNWWETFQDPVLNQLIEQALNSSYTLWAALERVIEARAQAKMNFAPLMPNVNFAPSFLRTGSLFQNPFPVIGNNEKNAGYPSKKPSQASPLSNNGRDFRFVQTQYLVPLNLTYEIDLWSQLRNNYYAYLIRSQAASQAYLSVLLSLTADIASTYFQIRRLDAQEEVVQGNIRGRQRAVDLNRNRYHSGLVIFLDVSRAEVELARAKSDLDDVQRLRGLQENMLASLLGVPASVFTLPPQPLVYPPPQIPRGLPSELLCRRPDIAEAERNLAASYREIGVAYANFYPSLNLNAAFGFESPFAAQLLSWRSRFWQVGYSFLQTVFDGGRNEANLEYAQSKFREKLADYEQTVLKAFEDVENALVDLRGYAEQAKDLAEAVRAARVTLELAQMRYNIGLTNYLDVVDAERQLLETEQNSVIVLGNRYSSTVMLIKALGGGWGPCEVCDDL